MSSCLPVQKNTMNNNTALELFKKLSSNKDLFTDFKVHVGGVEFKCHRFVLSSCSEFFEAMMRTEMKEKTESSCTLHDISPEIFQDVLDYIYDAKNVLNKENIIEIWHASNLLQIPVLILACEDYIKENLNLENYWVIYQEAKLLDSLDLINTVKYFITLNFSSVVESDAFVHFSFDDFMDILKENSFFRADLLVHSVLKWTCSGDSCLTTEPNQSIGIQQKAEAEASPIIDRRGEVKFATLDEEELLLRRAYLDQLLAVIHLQDCSDACLKKLMENEYVVENIGAMSVFSLLATSYGSKERDIFKNDFYVHSIRSSSRYKPYVIKTKQYIPYVISKPPSRSHQESTVLKPTQQFSQKTKVQSSSADNATKTSAQPLRSDSSMILNGCLVFMICIAIAAAICVFLSVYSWKQQQPADWRTLFSPR